MKLRIEVSVMKLLSAVSAHFRSVSLLFQPINTFTFPSLSSQPPQTSRQTWKGVANTPLPRFLLLWPNRKGKRRRKLLQKKRAKSGQLKRILKLATWTTTCRPTLQKWPIWNVFCHGPSFRQIFPPNPAVNISRQIVADVIFFFLFVLFVTGNTIKAVEDVLAHFFWWDMKWMSLSWKNVS